MLHVSSSQMMMQEATQYRTVYPSSGCGAVRPAKGVCEGTVLSCTRSACSRGYKQGERGREAPKSLLGVESVERNAQLFLNVLLEREARETEQTRVQSSPG